MEDAHWSPEVNRLRRRPCPVLQIGTRGINAAGRFVLQATTNTEASVPATETRQELCHRGAIERHYNPGGQCSQNLTYKM